MLKKEELQRYNRQIILPEVGINGQNMLKNASVLMIGAGGLGCPVLQYLAAAGVGKIGIVDRDVVDISNLQRQILYNAADVGKPKARVAKQKLEALNPHIFIQEYQVKLSAENAESIINEYDIVIDGSDNFTTRYLVNDTCVDLGKPLVFGSIFKFEGHVAVFNYQGGPNYRDVFPEPPADDEVPNCDEIGVIGVLPGIIGTYMANEVIKIICGLGEVLSGKFLALNMLDNSMTVFNVVKQTGTTTQKQQSKIEEPVLNQEISMDTVNNWVQQEPENICLIDVRETYEYEDFNIGGINIPLYELTERIDTLPVNKKLVFYCQTGQRSRMAIQLIKSKYTGEMYSVKNGIFQ
ncbi:HesA/MoeB/ThiF family protein [Mucilaginibacter sabulilitoris]|uniref:HesA/MoeB/ThiF family protein n=1 Tax=Mucilaginibacter sabulilitoris TaxID=1173583 RepID=A0ABZ0TKL5_9SPHI|nr:HesA/MoeB/ThiF family protein [Mucilaginibacter sabulilitoris]WPU92090.1 HesA/MoeB/ThiF family protein [Mucilaginibacter sabulilitoris]